MKLIDLLSVISEYTKVQVWKDNDLVAEYDDKNSIDEKYNNEEVKSVSAGLYKIYIEI